MTPAPAVDELVEQLGHCSSCQARIAWVTTEGGRRMPLDPAPHAAGTVVLVRIGGHRRARVLTGRDLPTQGVAYRPHWTTCPHSEHHRRRRLATAPRCQACRGPMDAELARLERWAEHPCCDSAAIREHAAAVVATRRRAGAA